MIRSQESHSASARRGRRVGTLAVGVRALDGHGTAGRCGRPRATTWSALRRSSTLGVAVDFDSADATISPTDPTDCDGSHGAFPGPYYASVWFSYTAKSAGQLNLSAPTMQDEPGPVPRDLVRIRADRVGADLDRLHCVRQRRLVVRDAGHDLPDHGGWPRTRPSPRSPSSPTGAASGRSRSRDPPTSAHYSFIDFGSRTRRLRIPTVERRGRPTAATFHLRAGDSTATRRRTCSTTTSGLIVHTNPANGKWFLEGGNGLIAISRITKVEGTIYSVRGPGRWFGRTAVARWTARRSSSATVAGRSTTFQVDTKGDDDLGERRVHRGQRASCSPRTDRTRPLFFEGDFCDIVNDLLS